MNFFTATQNTPSWFSLLPGGSRNNHTKVFSVKDYNGDPLVTAQGSPAELTVPNSTDGFNDNPSDAGGTLGQPVNGASVGSQDPGSTTAYSSPAASIATAVQSVTGMTGTQLIQWLVVLVIGFFFLKWVAKHL